MSFFNRKRQAKRKIFIYFLGYLTIDLKPRNRIVETVYPIEEVAQIKYLQSKLLEIDKSEGLASPDDKEPVIISISLLSQKEI